MIPEVAERLQQQTLARTGNAGGNVKGRTRRVPVSVGEWSLLMEVNNNRRLLEIVNRGGALGPGSVALAFDAGDPTSAFHFDRFAPNTPPTNAIYVYAESAYGDTTVYIEFVEG